MLVECVANVSEGRDAALLASLERAAGPTLRDRHSDPDHHRSVFTLVGEVAAVEAGARDLSRATVATLDLSAHAGVHPRLGVLDVVPFVPYRAGHLPPSELREVVVLRDDFAQWLGGELGVPAFAYGPRANGTRSLPEVRRQAFTTMDPEAGPAEPHPTVGACAVGARPVLVAYNVWVSSPAVAREVAAVVRGPFVRTLGLAVGNRAQVSCNLIAPAQVGPADLYDAVVKAIGPLGGLVEGAELVGLIPAALLDAIPPDRWDELDLASDRTVESRL